MSKKTSKPEKVNKWPKINKKVETVVIENPSSKKPEQIKVNLEKVVKPVKKEVVKKTDIKKEVLVEEIVLKENKPKLVRFNTFLMFYNNGVNKATMLNRKHHPHWHHLHSKRVCEKCDLNEPTPLRMYNVPR